MKKQQNHEFASNRLKNCRNQHYSSSEIILLQEYNCHTLLIKLQLLISLFRKEACQNIFSDQQENFISLLKCEVHCREFDHAHHSTKKLQIQHNKHLLFIIRKL